MGITGGIQGTSKEKLYQERGLQKMVSKMISLLQNNKKRVTVTSLSSNSKASTSYSTRNSEILPPEFIRPHPNSIFNVLNFLGLTYFTRLRAGLGLLREHIFRHKFRDSLDPICNCAVLLNQLSTTFYAA